MSSIEGIRNATIRHDEIDALVAATYLDRRPETHDIRDYRTLLSHDRDTIVARIHALYAQACRECGLQYYFGSDCSFQEKRNLILLLAGAYSVESEVDAALALANDIPEDAWEVERFHPFSCIGFDGIRKSPSQLNGPSYTYKAAYNSGATWECVIADADVAHLVDLGYPVVREGDNKYRGTMDCSRLHASMSALEEFPQLASRLHPGSLEFDQELVRLAPYRISDIRQAHLSEELYCAALGDAETGMGGLFMLADVHPDWRTPKICMLAIERQACSSIRRLDRMVFRWVPEASKTGDVIRAYEEKCREIQAAG